MDAAQIKKLKRLAGEAELDVIERGDEIRIIGGKHVVTWWPLSRRMTAYVQGAARGQHYATPKQVIALALGTEAA